MLIKGRCLDQFPSDVFQGGAGTSVNMNTNEVIANLALEALGHAKGRYDLCTPTRSAWDLKQALPQADLRIIQSGHYAQNPAIADALVQATDEFAERLGA